MKKEIINLVDYLIEFYNITLLNEKELLTIIYWSIFKRNKFKQFLILINKGWNDLLAFKDIEKYYKQIKF